ncbi:MAG: hypothetical protein MRERC_9c064 [Mycoplasmataceae bacterium RC_NB112A]|nr:MAG: hypothetical protein MRERC_9c064 [Mycoplasmataceae bacterium RC_NB112A]
MEINEEAVKDAQINSALNNLNNTRYILGPIEKNLSFLDELSHQESGTVIAIIDPPRAGRGSQKVIKSLRQCKAIESLIYISCNQKAAIPNLVDLCSPPGKSFSGLPFQLVKAAGVDLFPHTKHFELIMEFWRSKVNLKAAENM